MDGMGGIKMGAGVRPTHLFSPYRSWKGQMRRIKSSPSMGKSKVSNPLAPVKIGKLAPTVSKIVG